MNHDFADPSLLELALTHTSWAHENQVDHNERLEFLGDAVLQLCTTEVLYARFPEAREGVLHSYRTNLVSTEHLAGLAQRWGFDEQMRLGRGEEGSGGRTKERLLAGVFEAVLGAIYLDGGMQAARAAVAAAIDPDIDQLGQSADPRQVLHEWAQANHGDPPLFDVVAEVGPPHAMEFHVVARVDGADVGKGSGPSKRAATLAAAADAVQTLGLVD